MRILITFKGSASSGWYSPPKGTHSGEKHRSVGSGRGKKSGKAPTKGVAYATHHGLSDDERHSIYGEMGGWKGDRHEIATLAIWAGEKGSDVLLLRDGSELKGIAAITKDLQYEGLPSCEVEFLATKERGYGKQMMLAIARTAERSGRGVHLVAVPKATGFYRAIGMNPKSSAIDWVFHWTLGDIEELSL